MPVAPKRGLVQGCCRAVAPCVAVETNPRSAVLVAGQIEQMKPEGVLVVEEAQSFLHALCPPP